MAACLTAGCEFVLNGITYDPGELPDIAMSDGPDVNPDLLGLDIKMVDMTKPIGNPDSGMDMTNPNPMPDGGTDAAIDMTPQPTDGPPPDLLADMTKIPNPDGGNTDGGPPPDMVPEPDLKMPLNCGNLKQDGDETDVDCGGSCSPCVKQGMGCKLDADCDNTNEGLLCIMGACGWQVVVTDVSAYKGNLQWPAAACGRWLDSTGGNYPGGDFPIIPNSMPQGPAKAMGIIGMTATVKDGMGNFVSCGGFTTPFKEIQGSRRVNNVPCKAPGGTVNNKQGFEIGKGGLATCKQVLNL
jgi:hypothetical protein